VHLAARQKRRKKFLETYCIHCPLRLVSIVGLVDCHGKIFSRFDGPKHELTIHCRDFEMYKPYWAKK
jgi:hypothetical protein